MKKLIELLFYGLGAATLIMALNADKEAERLYQENIVNRSGIPPCVNQQAPDFTIQPLLSDDNVTSADLTKKGNVILIITSPSCPYTMHLADSLKPELENNSVSFEKVNLVLDTKQTKLSIEEKEKWLTDYSEFKVYTDVEASTVWGFKVQAYPTIYVLSQDGTVLYRQSGYAENSSVKYLVQTFSNKDLL